MSNFVTYNLSRLTVFEGRETRVLFWPYVGVVLVLQMFASLVAMMVLMGPAMARAQTFALAHPEFANGQPIDARQLPESVKAEGLQLAQVFTEAMSGFAIASGVLGAIMVLLYAAAAVRRLHDRGLSGWWGLMPLPFLAFGMIAMPRLFENFASPSGPDLGLFGLLAINNVVYIATLISLIVLLAKPSDPGVNRHGPPTMA